MEGAFFGNPPPWFYALRYLDSLAFRGHRATFALDSSACRCTSPDLLNFAAHPPILTSIAVYVAYSWRLVPLGIAWRRAAFHGPHEPPQRNAMRRSSLPVDEMRPWHRPYLRNAGGPSALIAWHAAAPYQRIRAASPAPPRGHLRPNQTILSPGIPKNPPCCRPRVDWAGSTAGTAWRAPNYRNHVDAAPADRSGRAWTPQLAPRTSRVIERRCPKPSRRATGKPSPVAIHSRSAPGEYSSACSCVSTTTFLYTGSPAAKRSLTAASGRE